MLNGLVFRGCLTAYAVSFSWPGTVLYLGGPNKETEKKDEESSSVVTQREEDKIR